MNNVKTPMIKSELTTSQRKEIIETHVRGILEALDLDLSDDSLKNTPKRVAKMYVDEIFSGLREETFPEISVFENKMQTTQMVAVKDITVISMCEHHMMLIEGKAVVAYIPKDKIIGLSKLSRVVDYYSKRPQVQERLTVQIAQRLSQELGTDDIAVYIDAKHYCMMARGVREANTSTVTTELRGKFLSQEQTRMEFLNLCRK